MPIRHPQAFSTTRDERVRTLRQVLCVAVNLMVDRLRLAPLAVDQPVAGVDRPQSTGWGRVQARTNAARATTPALHWSVTGAGLHQRVTLIRPAQKRWISVLRHFQDEHDRAHVVALRAQLRVACGSVSCSMT
jgi:hypothetical protein